MATRAIVALGIGQCVNWGVLYYAFAVLVVPLQRDLASATWVVTGAFSLALLMSAAAAPAIGRLGDRDHGALVMQLGGLSAAAVLAAWALLPGLPALYVAWAALGVCMAATLYEPAFAIVGRAHGDPSARLRALGTVTLFGGLASTIFLPATALLSDAAGWRSTVLVLAVLLVASTACVRVLAFRDLAPREIRASVPPADRGAVSEIEGRRFQIVAAVFTLASLASSAFMTNLLPALAQRGIAPKTGALLGGLIGVMQLPGRALVMHGVFAGSPRTLLAVSLMLHAAGLGVVAVSSSISILSLGTAVFALGAGLTTIVRPHLVQTMFGIERGGWLNGRIARQQQLARAAGPILTAWLAGVLGYGTVFAALAGVFAVVAVRSPGALGTITTFDKEAL